MEKIVEDSYQGRSCLANVSEELLKAFGYRICPTETLIIGNTSFRYLLLHLPTIKGERKGSSGRFGRDFGVNLSTLGILCTKKTLPRVPPSVLGILYIPTAELALPAIQSDFQYETVVFFNGGDHVMVSTIISNGLHVGEGLIEALYRQPTDDQKGSETDYQSLNSWPEKKRDPEKQKIEKKLSIRKDELKKLNEKVEQQEEKSEHKDEKIEQQEERIEQQEEKIEQDDKIEQQDEKIEQQDKYISIC